MPLNWVKYPVSGVLSPELTAEDLEFVTFGRIHEYYQGVKLLWLIRTNHLPNDLRTKIQETTPSDVCQALEDAVRSGVVDTGWADDYYHAIEEISLRMRGFPKDLLKQHRRLKSLLAEPHGQTGKPPQNIPKDTKPTTSKNSTGSGVFNFFKLPHPVRERIYRFLLVQGTIRISDYSPDYIPKSLFRRTEYEVYDTKKRRYRRTNYTVRGRKAYLNIMLVNKAICAESQKVFYGENVFSFQGTANASLAFFHDRASRLDTLRKISMRYTCNPATKFKGCHNATCAIPLPPLTFPAAWRRIFNLFVHTSIGLEDLELILDNSFWWAVRWQSGASAIFTTPKLCEPANLSWRDGDRNFLQHVARLGGVNLRLTIEGEGVDAEKMKFRRELEELIQKQGFKRPYLAEDQKPECTCRRRLLGECCIWDKEGKMRRGL